MLGLQGLVFETLLRIQRFLDDDTATFDAVNHSDARTRLDDTVAQMGSHAVAQAGGHRTSQGETARQRQLRLALRTDHLRPIAVIASQKLRDQPEDFTKLRMPRAQLKGPRLTAAARDMANAAEKYTELFVKEGLAPDFVAQLRAAADILDESIKTRGQSLVQRAGATTGLKAQTARARAVIRQLDALVRPKLGTNEEKLRTWEVASHIKRQRTPQGAPTAAGPSTASTQAATASSTPGTAAVITPTGPVTNAA
jgi:hypothetical protein